MVSTAVKVLLEPIALLQCSVLCDIQAVASEDVNPDRKDGEKVVKVRDIVVKKAVSTCLRFFPAIELFNNVEAFPSG